MDDGKAYAAYEEGTFPCERGNATVEILNLNDVRIVEARIAIYEVCNNLIEQGDQAYSHYLKGSPAGIKDFKKVCSEIRDMMSPKARYSSTARAYLQMQAITYPWLQPIVGGAFKPVAVN